MRSVRPGYGLHTKCLSEMLGKEFVKNCDKGERFTHVYMNGLNGFDYTQHWKNILDTDVLRGNINLIAIYIMVYELLEDIIISRPKDLYTIIEFDEEAQKNYEKHVLSLYDKRAFPYIKTKNKTLIASLIWFRNLGAIDENDINIFADARTLRNEITHEMLTTISVGTEKLVEQFCIMHGLFCKIEKWWILEMEVPITGDYKVEEIDQEGVMSGNMILLDIIIDILANNSNVNFREACEKLGITVK